MKNHPYNSYIFKEKWINHFTTPENVTEFNYLLGPSFLKKKNSETYYNTTSTFTLQNYYKINRASSSEELKGKTILIFDVPDYFKINTNTTSTNLKIVPVREYIGYLIDLDKIDSFNSYLSSRFNSKKKSQIKGYSKKLEKKFNIKYNMYFGEITKEKYDYIMDCFYDLSIKSFKKKGLKNRKLIPKNFNFTKDIIYNLIGKKQACIFVVYKDATPIGISVNYNSNNILFGDSTVYDTLYSKYNVGTIMLMKQLEWCFSNKINTFDFSKGYFPYKKTWCNTTYHFEHHIVYDTSSFKATLTAYKNIYFLKTKQFLREHPLRNYFNKIKNYLLVKKA